MPNESVRPRSQRPSPARWWLLVVLLPACKAPPAPRAPEVRAPVSTASAAPTLPSSAAKPPTTVPCPPRPGFAPLGFTVEHTERKGKRGEASVAGPRFSTTDPELAGSVAGVQAAIDQWFKDRSPGNFDVKPGEDDPGHVVIHQECEVTRNDGTTLSVLCSNAGSFGGRGGVARDAFLFHREGKAFRRVTVEAFATNPKVSLVARTFPSVEAEVPFDPSPKAKGTYDGGGAYYATLRDIALEIGPRDSSASEERKLTPFSQLSRYLTCDAALDMPAGPPAVATGETGALAVATSIFGWSETDLVESWGFAPTLERPRFVALEARHAAAARLLNDAIDGYFAKVRERAKSEFWTGAEASCRVETSTDKLASVLCQGSGYPDGKSKTVRGSITVLLGATPQRVSAATIFARHPGAPAQIARHCLGSLVRAPRDADDAVLRALPRLTAADLGDFAVARTGIFFAVEYDLAEHHRVMSCHVPYGVLGTSLEALSAP